MGALGIAPPDVKDVTLALFGGRKTDIAPSDCPEGLTPDEQDNIFLPGDVQSRPGLERLYAAGKLTPGTSVLYKKTYVQPNDQALTLVLTSDGILWAENITSSPGNPAQIGTVPAGTYGQSVTEFGREYIAFSDLLHGQGIPLQFDGTNLDRVTMDGPGAGPTVVNYLPIAATVASPGAPNTKNIIASPNGIVFGGLYISPGGISYYTFFTVTTSAPHGFSAGQPVTIAGATPALINTTWTIAGVSPTTFDVNFTIRQVSAPNGGGGTATQTLSNASIVRQNNVATAVTNAAHGFQVGWQVQISGIANTNIGGGISSVSRDGNGIVTVVTASAHGLPQGATIAIAGVNNPDTSFNGTFQVASVISPTSFTYVQGGTVEASGAGSGNVQDIWNVTAFIQSVPSTTTFTYQQIGPNDTTTGSGTATIIGQVSPGAHQVVVMWLTRQGYLSKPSPPVQIVANGAQQYALSNLPIGPANVVARVLAFTGAGGANYFTLTATPQIAGQIVGTVLIVPDNTTTSTIVDIADNTLFAGIPIDQIGNDLFDQVVLGPVLGFFAFASRLVCWGDYNKVENFLNLGFCGGYLSGTLTGPLGWDASANAGGTLVNGGSWASGMAWQITGDGTAAQKGLLRQTAYQTYLGTGILSANTQYSVRFWAKASAGGLSGSVFVSLTSASTAFSATAQFAINALSTAGALTSFVAFSQIMPNVIPADLLLSIYETNLNNAATVTLGEFEIIFTANPYRDNFSRWSYVNNPEAFALTTGNLGPDDDSSPIRCFSLLRASGILASAEGIHTFADNSQEPDTWNVNALTRSLGAASLRGLDPGKFGTGDGAEDWLIVASINGAYLFAGAEFWKISQEISRGTLPQTQDPRKTYSDLNLAVQQTIVAKNDPLTRRAYISVPLNGATTPNGIFVLDYREMDTATQIASAPPLHITIQGKMRSSDLTRKWSFWNVYANTLEILIRPGNLRQLYFGGGLNPSAQVFGNIYSLSKTNLTDDDYGQISPYYTTYAFTDHEQEQGLQLGSGKKLVKAIHAFVAGVGSVMITPIINSLNNFQPALSQRILVLDTDQSNFLANDLEWTTNIRGQRIFFRVSVQPLPGATDVQYRLQKFIAYMMKDPVAPFRQSIV